MTNMAEALGIAQDECNKIERIGDKLIEEHYKTDNLMSDVIKKIAAMEDLPVLHRVALAHYVGFLMG